MDLFDYNFCCGPCKIHVRKGAFVITIVGIVLCTISSVTTIFLGQTNGRNIFIGVAELCFAVAYASVFIALRMGKHRWILPYLLFGKFYLACNLIILLILIGQTIAAPQTEIDEINKQTLLQQRGTGQTIDVGEFRVFHALLAIFYAIEFSLNVWFYTVIYRAYKFMKYEGVTTKYTGNYERY